METHKSSCGVHVLVCQVISQLQNAKATSLHPICFAFSCVLYNSIDESEAHLAYKKLKGHFCDLANAIYVARVFCTQRCNFPEVTKETNPKCSLVCFAGHIASAIFSSRVSTIIPFFIHG